jgi:hypothetical protein
VWNFFSLSYFVSELLEIITQEREKKRDTHFQNFGQPDASVRGQRRRSSDETLDVLAVRLKLFFCIHNNIFTDIGAITLKIVADFSCFLRAGLKSAALCDFSHSAPAYRHSAGGQSS